AFDLRACVRNPPPLASQSGQDSTISMCIRRLPHLKPPAPIDLWKGTTFLKGFGVRGLCFRAAAGWKVHSTQNRFEHRSAASSCLASQEHSLRHVDRSNLRQHEMEWTCHSFRPFVL